MKKQKKGFSPKQFLISHGEKLGVGVVAILALMGLASANWSTEQRTPGELRNKASATVAAMEANPWPEEKQAVFSKTPDVKELARRMTAPNEDVEQYALTVPFFEPLNRLREKRGPVVVLPAMDPEQTAIVVPIAMLPEQAEEDESTEDDDQDGRGEDDDEETEEERDRRERLSPSRAGVAGAGFPGGGFPGGGFPGGPAAGLAGGLPGDLESGGGPGFGGPGVGGPGVGGTGVGGPGFGGPGGRGRDGRGARGDRDARGRGGRSGAAGDRGMGAPGMKGGMAGAMGGMEDPIMMMGLGEFGGFGGMLGTSVQEKRIDLKAGISVRFVFDLREQRKKMADALHLMPADPRVAAYSEDFVDLIVERKQAISAPDPWSGEWELVSSESLGDPLTESLAFDLDVVNPLVTRPVITMPLPRRAQGRWSAGDVSHKRISEFVLSDEEKEIIRRRDEKLAERINEWKDRLPAMRAERKGFSGFRANANTLMQGLGMAGMGRDMMMDDAMNAMPGDMEMKGAGMAGPGVGGAAGVAGGRQMTKKQKEEMEKLRKKLLEPDATNRLLLVRFIDFTADRGHEYIYRVRLEMNNPNFNMHVDDLELPELATQKTIFSDWSVPTKPVLLPSAYRYYVDKVASQGQPFDKVDFSMYYEVPDKGTPVVSQISVPTGVRIGAEKEVEVVDLSKSVIEASKVDFRSSDLLCAVQEAPRFSGGDHPDLQAILTKNRGRRVIPDQILVLSPRGDLVLRSSGDAARDEKRDKDDYEYILAEYEKMGWKADSQNQQGGDPFGAAAAMMPGDFGGMGMGDPLSMKNKKRDRRRGGRDSGGGPGGFGRGNY